MTSRRVTGVDLYWLPLGAGGHSVRLNGKVVEAVAAWLGRRDRCDLYHSALEVHVPERRFVIEQAPAWGDGSERGVVAEGSVGARAARAFRLFRYEIRRWRDGIIPDVEEAALAGSATIRIAPGGCSSSYPKCRRPSGAASTTAGQCAACRPSLGTGPLAAIGSSAPGVGFDRYWRRVRL